MSDDEVRETHESYGLVQFSRRGGHPGRLFGSSLKVHESFVTLAIKKAVLIREQGYDRYHGSMRGDIIEVDLSAAQFAELLTTMNIGSGVPCTVRSVGSKTMEAPPDIPLEAEQVRNEFRTDVRRHVAELPKAMAAIEAILEKKVLSQADRVAIRRACIDLFRLYMDKAPFLLDMFEEATEKLMQHARAEIDACLQHLVTSTGLRVLQEKAAQDKPLLPVGFEEEDA